MTPKFYGLPKIHKNFENFPPSRPIVSGCNSCCERVSHFVDSYLKPLTRRNPSFIQDTTDFLRKMKDVKTKNDDILVAADVTNLYTVIDHMEGANACKDTLNERPLEEKTRRPTRFIVNLILLILQSNCFKFGERLFRQHCGTAMGTPMAASYANVYMGNMEKKMLDAYERKTGLRPSFWYRFLDDVIFLWSHGDEKLQDFLTFMQNFTENEKMRTKLKFTFDYGKKVSFLDTQVIIENGGIRTDLYSKPTDAHLYLRSNSCHPTSCKKGLVKAEMLRVRRICSLDTDYRKQSEVMRSHFLKWGFENDSINRAIKEVAEIPRESLLEYRTKEKTSRIPLVLQFHPRLRGVSQVLQKHFPILNSSERLKKAFQEPPMVAFR